MNKQKGDLTRTERFEISILLGKGYSLRAIASVLERSPNTLSYEVQKNSVCGVYDPRKAHAKARFRKRMRKLEWFKLDHDMTLRTIVIEKLEAHWNPDEIAGWLRRTKKYGYVSKTALYEWLRTSRGERYCIHLYSKRRRVKKQKLKARRVLIPNRVGIAQRSVGADNRTRGGHWERDTVVGRKGTPGGLATAQERKTRFLVVCKVGSMRSQEHLVTDQGMFAGMKTLSITRDNGIENRAHEGLVVPSFFCDPYSSWQKGSIENANKMLRRYFPKGTNFEEVSPYMVDHAVALINSKPRKILGYRSALEVAQKAGIIKNESVLIQG